MPEMLIAYGLYICTPVHFHVYVHAGLLLLHRMPSFLVAKIHRCPLTVQQCSQMFLTVCALLYFLKCLILVIVNWIPDPSLLLCPTSIWEHDTKLFLHFFKVRKRKECGLSVDGRRCRTKQSPPCLPALYSVEGSSLGCQVSFF